MAFYTPRIHRKGYASIPLVGAGITGGTIYQAMPVGGQPQPGVVTRDVAYEKAAIYRNETLRLVAPGPALPVAAFLSPAAMRQADLGVATRTRPPGLPDSVSTATDRRMLADGQTPLLDVMPRVSTDPDLDAHPDLEAHPVDARPPAAIISPVVKAGALSAGVFVGFGLIRLLFLR